MPSNTSGAAPGLSVVIVNVNTRDWLEPCLKSLEKQAVFDVLEIVVVDNGCTDGSAEMVRRNFPFCKLVRLEKTVGFGAANNAGVQYTRAPLLLLLNPDTVVPENALGEFLRFMEETPRCGVAGGLIYDGTGELERSTGAFPTALTVGLDGLLKYCPPARPLLGRCSQQHWRGYDRRRRVDWVTGACLCIRREIFEKIGGFDEKIYMYVEDVDLCYRACREAGAECWFFPQGAIVHYRNKAPAPRSRKAMRRESLRYFARTHYRSPRFWITRLAFWAMAKI